MSEIKDRLSKPEGIRVNRRELIKKSLQIGGAAYVAPMVMASVAKVSAQVSPGPNPECIGATCATFVACAANPTCVCTRSAQGGGFCIDGSTLCSTLVACGASPDFTCPTGSFCAVDTCCGSPVCVPFATSAVCQTGPAASARSPRSGPEGTTIGY